MGDTDGKADPRTDSAPVETGVLAPGLSVVFVNFEPGPADLRLRHHHARRNNQFWRLLAESGLTPRRLRPEEDERLLEWGVGLINPVKRRAGRGREPAGTDLPATAPALSALMANCPPKVLAFTGKGVYLRASARTNASWGRQPFSLFEGVPDLVVPSPSGKVRMTFAAKLKYYQEVANLVRQL